jgi:hypothetical protein
VDVEVGAAASTPLRHPEAAPATVRRAFLAELPPVRGALALLDELLRM